VDRNVTTTLPAFDELERRADAHRPGVPIAVASEPEPTVLEALGQATDRGWVRPTLVGQAEAAVAEVRAGRARMLMKGLVSTPALMRAVLDPAVGLRTGRVVCQVVLMEVAGRRFFLADTGVSIRPTLDQKADILRHTVEAAHALGLARPRVAVMAATESVTETMPETVDAAELQRRAKEGEFGDCWVQGPLSFDLAWEAGAGQRKGVEGPVAGAADVMLLPDLVSANLTVKAIMYTADCRFGGVLAGVACPVVFMSRSDSTATRLRSLALALALSC
jgi:phosphotransacetylase